MNINGISNSQAQRILAQEIGQSVARNLSRAGCSTDVEPISGEWICALRAVAKTLHALAHSGYETGQVGWPLVSAAELRLLKAIKEHESAGKGAERKT